MAIVLCILEGYSRSKSTIDLSDMVEEELAPHFGPKLIRKAWFGNHQVRRFCRFIKKNESMDNVLFLVGKSLGGRNILQVFNKLGKGSPPALCGYKAVILFTIDVNYPLIWSWTPNLNNVWLPLARKPTRAVNVFLKTSRRRQQAGAQVEGAVNVPVLGLTHQSIVEAMEVTVELRRLAKFAQYLDNQ